MRSFSIVVLAAIATQAMAQQPDADQRVASHTPSSAAVEVSTGVEFEEGTYGTGQKIRRLSVPNSVRVAAGRLEVAATVPYTRLVGPANVVAGGGLLGLPIIVDPSRPAARDRRQGLGDVSLAAAYAVTTPVLDLKALAEVKLPTASRKLGTGKTDYLLGAQASKTIGAVTPFVGVGYTMPGDPEGFSLRNSLSTTAGIAAKIGAKTRGFVSYNHAQSADPSLSDEQQVTTGVNTALSDSLSLGAYGAAGLSKGSPDVGAGIRLGVRIN